MATLASRAASSGSSRNRRPRLGLRQYGYLHSPSPQPTAESQPLPRECNRAARELGAFASYQTGSRALTAPELAKCNSRRASFLANG